MRSFETYLPKPLTRWVLGYPNADRVPPVESQVTVIFTDIVGFTALAENQPAAAIADFLNDHFALSPVALKRKGGQSINSSATQLWRSGSLQTVQAIRKALAAPRWPSAKRWPRPTSSAAHEANRQCAYASESIPAPQSSGASGRLHA
jgi:class 3 adenylate cyclase